MKSVISPFKKKSHSRQSSRDEGQSHSSIHMRTTSASSTGAPKSSDTIPPVTGSTQSHKRTTSRSSTSSQNSNFLAEQYDRDLKRIISSCFTKPDSKKGTPPNNYITHVRIIEDAKYSSVRPGPDSKLEYKKKRVLILSSMANNPKKVSLHKARENSDGTFQIGRTWDLEEIVKVERDTEIPEGFLLTMGKTYYWETNSPKERTVFIKSLIKMYSQVFEGHVPELVNWDLSMFYLDERSYSRAVRGAKTVFKSVVSPTTDRITPEISGNVADSFQTFESSVPPPRSSYRNSNDIKYYQNEGNLQMNRDSQPEVQQHLLERQNQLERENQKRAEQEQMKQQEMEQRRQAQELELRRRQEMEQHRQQELELRRQQEMEQRRQLEEQIQFEEQRRQQEMEQQRQRENQRQLEEQQESLRQRELKRQAVTREQEQLKGTQQNARGPAQNSLEKAPYQYNPTINEVNERLTPEQLNIPPTSANGEEYNDITESYMGNDASAGVQKQSDSVLENINAMLSDNMQEENGLPAPIPLTEPDLNDSLNSEISYTEAVPLPEEPPAEDDFNAPVDLNAPLENQEVVASKRAVSQPDDSELSFEQGDEVRYSGNFTQEEPHRYHEVSTIQEEEHALPDISDDNIKATASKGSKRVQIKDEELLETLTDINWELDDDADTLIDRLNAKMIEANHSFNKNIITLQTIGPELVPYGESVEQECSKMNPAFSLFLMELNNFSQDIKYLEIQENGLQIESANKKMLWNTLSDLLNTVSLDEDTLKELLKCSIRERNLPWMETQLSLLSKALEAISGEASKQEYTLKDMEALKRRRHYYEKVTELFLERLVKEMGSLFANIKNDGTTNEQLISILQRLLVFSSLISFCKGIDKQKYNLIVEKWNKNIQAVYSGMWGKVLENVKQIASRYEPEKGIAQQQGAERLLQQWQRYRDTRKITTEEPMYIPLLESITSMLDFIQQHCAVYQNFVTIFFHISSDMTFSEYVAKYKDPSSRVVPLDAIQQMDSNRESAIAESKMVSEVFRHIISELVTSLSDLSKSNQTIQPSIMLLLESKIKRLESSNQEFLFAAFKKIHEQMKQLWSDFIDSQVLYIERAVTNNFNKDIFPVVYGLPIFVKNVQDSLIHTARTAKDSDVGMAESNVLKLNSFKKLAVNVVNLLQNEENAETSTSLAKPTISASDLNKTRTLLMNYNWLIELLTAMNGPVGGIFDDAIQNSKNIFESEKDKYANFMLQDTMPKLKSFVDGATRVMETTVTERANPSTWGAYSKQNLQIILNSYSTQEVKVLVRKLHKHLLEDASTGQPESMNMILCEKLWSCLQGQTVSLYLRLYTLLEKYYRGLHPNFSKNDIISAFEEYKK
ncbi:GTP-Rho binding exocyst subunit SEC3 KNAG_0L00830 [Huiozyma naganishii CBS 8797]|uniref:Exocyst complex component Sec3 PIP2-binding N-terminal domain-containing protein n=1 Tax=Huiozyma naganishii (strain ATCC MYA-139 / BCRC 22969 / CBS 8797 / KCTC 17520 / NBRC 10181 / NCYC 3082 / Yp74L-3) TaxID=1071383 RepID=J7SAF3_HUIN7|nr:hypothetical protein KNAG_0L00830 [Kazachstania naganishii CBS 8797]CCK72704.1 hypothetical protein KNAG_0L00830 [Kazachstania naganishii CBS 8797]